MIEFIKLKCPSCGSDLQIDSSLDVCYCQYCGTKILIDGQSDATINAKKEIEMQKEKHRAEKEKREFETNESNKTFKQLIIVCSVIFVLSIFGYMYFLNSEKKEIRELNELYSEILVDMQNEDYDIALLKANRLRASSSQTKDTQQQWDETRETLIKEINAKKDKSR